MFKTPKYRAKKVVVDGVNFDSKRESLRYAELKLLEKAGQICNLQLQVPFVLQPKCVGKSGKKYREIKYIADFTYYKDGEFIVEDSKKFKTKEYLIKRKMFCYTQGGLEILET